MNDHATAARFRASREPPARQSECEPSFTLERHIASLRDTDPEKWARLNLEWEGQS
jgi:hypothetical protein